MDIRKLSEKQYHNLKRDDSLGATELNDYVTSQRKWYSVTRASRNCWENWLQENCAGKQVLDFCCGNGDCSIKIAKYGAAEVVGIDLSDVSLENARRMAIQQGVKENTSFLEIDGENMEFKDNSFDIVFESGVLHHLDLQKAYSELSRVLRAEGTVICNETLGHNPLISLYRRRTPHLRTEWEIDHILKRKDIELATNYFKEVKILGFFHLASIAAVPFRNSPFFNVLLRFLETTDRILLKLPVIKWQAWQVVFALAKPKKNPL